MKLHGKGQSCPLMVATCAGGATRSRLGDVQPRRGVSRQTPFSLCVITGEQLNDREKIRLIRDPCVGSEADSRRIAA